MVIVLEGHSYSGKTTLFNYLKDNLGVFGVSEHDIYAGGQKNYPPFPALNEQMARTSVDFFASLELKRAKVAHASSSTVTLYDRSYLGVILFQKYVMRLGTASHFQAYAYAKKKFAELVQDKLVVLPDYFVHVRCDSLATYLQRQDRVENVELLKGQRALEFFEREYEKIYQVYKKHGRAMIIYSENNRSCLVENANVVSRAFKAKPLDEVEMKAIADELAGIL